MRRELEGWTIRDIVPHPPVLTLEEVLRYSSNVGISLLAERLPKETFFAYMEALGLTRTDLLPGIRVAAPSSNPPRSGAGWPTPTTPSARASSSPPAPGRRLRGPGGRGLPDPCPPQGNGGPFLARLLPSHGPGPAGGPGPRGRAHSPPSGLPPRGQDGHRPGGGERALLPGGVHRLVRRVRPRRPPPVHRGGRRPPPQNPDPREPGGRPHLPGDRRRALGLGGPAPYAEGR